MISYAEALTVVRERGLQLCSRLGNELVPLEECRSRILAEKISAAEDLPPFDNSAMDGYAIRSIDTKGATAELPATLTLSGTTAAGGTRGRLEVGKAILVMTGAPIPEGCDSVVRLEDVVVRGEDTRRDAEGSVVLKQPATPGQNVRCAGEDVKAGVSLLEGGSELRSSHILSLAAQGFGSLCVRQRPKAAILSTGSELVHHQTKSLRGAEIRSSTLPYLTNALQHMGCEVVSTGLCPDQPKEMHEALTSALNENPEILITTGGVSVGAFDYLPQVLGDLGATILFQKVEIRPGKPLLVAQFGDTTIFALPGNPVSSVVGLRFFIDPFLRTAYGMSAEKPVTAILDGGVKELPPDLTGFLRGSAEIAGGRLGVRAVRGQASFMVASFCESNAWIIVPPRSGPLAPGGVVEIVPLEKSFGGGEALWR